MGKKIYDEVESVLRAYPHTRNSDVSLTIMIWAEFHKDKMMVLPEYQMAVATQNLFSLPWPETISRCRRLIQNDEGRFLPTEWSVAKARRIKEDKWKEAMKVRDLTIFDD